MARRNWTEEDRTRGLQAIVLFGGLKPASRELRKAGHPVPVTTLRRWKENDPAGYQRARETGLDRVYAEVADEWKGLVREAIQAANETVAKARRATRDNDSKEARSRMSTSRDAGMLAGIGTQRASEADQRPQVSVVQHGDVRDIERKLRRLGVIESTAEELPDAVPALPEKGKRPRR